MLRKSVLTLACVCLLAGGALADDLNPEPWRWVERTTVQMWNFTTPGTGPIAGANFEYWEYTQPDGILDFNPNGEAVVRIWPGTGQHWWDELDGRQGVWPLSGTLEASIPNNPEPNDEKWIWIQLTWKPQAPGTQPIIIEKNSSSGATPILVIDLPGPWVHSTYKIVLPYNPPTETIRIDGAVDVDQLVIGTICIPEPATMSLLAVGGLAVLRRKRR